jgi:hypothetical protein
MRGAAKAGGGRSSAARPDRENARPGGRIPIDREETPHSTAWAIAAFADPGGTMKLLLLFVPCILALWVPLYNFIPPVFFGIPFFFWFQLVLVPISALTILAADRIGKD